VGTGLGPRRGDLDPHPGHGDRAVTLTGAPVRGRCQPGSLDAALGELRAAGWPAPEHPDSSEDTELDGRDNIADRLSDEVSWLRQCADWLAHLDADSYPPAVNLRPSADWPDRAVVAVDFARVAAVIDRIAADLDELARAQRVQDLNTAAVLPDPRAERRRRLASRTWSSGLSAPVGGGPIPQPRNWSGPGTPGRPSDTSAARSANGPGYTDNPFRPR
jgi:hypothetical protein